MSLINDALKRATRNQPTTPTPAPEPAAPMQPVEYRRRGLPWYFFPALLVILAAASWFIVKGVQARRQSSDPAGSPILVKARESVTPTPSAATAPGAEAPMPTVAASTTPPTPSGTVSAETRPASTAGSATAPQPVPEPPAEPPKPAFKLQGIFFRTANPSAIVNGRSVWVGSQVDGATVKAINRDNLTIEANGRTTVLTLD